MTREKPRVVLVSGGIGLGGATTFLLNLGGELVQREIPLLVVTLERSNPYARDFEARKIPLHREDERLHIFEDRIASALRAIRKFEPTVVVACLGPSSFEILRYLPAGVTRLGVIQSDFPENYPPFALYVPFLDGMVGVSREIVTQLETEAELGKVTAHYLPYGVAQVASPRFSNQPERPIRVLYLGRLCQPQKRVRLFPSILKSLRASGIEFSWTIAGDGDEREWLENEMSSGTESGKMTFLGALRYEEVPAVLEAHDIFLLASDAEGLPLSLLEAMGHGLVPVVSDLPSGVSEVVDPSCGILVPPEDTDGYAAGIIELARNREKMAMMAERAQARVKERYSVGAMTDRWLSLFERLESKEGARWSDQFRVEGPLGLRSIRFSALGRIFRRASRSLAVRRAAPLPSNRE